jgi:hypothetical protein
MKTLLEVRPIKQAKEADLLSIPNVTGVDIGDKFVGGERTNEIAIRVYVAQKKPLDTVPKGERVPATINGVKTDVIQRRFVLNPLMLRVADLKLAADTGVYDPLRGGISLGPCRSVYLDAAEATCHGAPGAGWYIFTGTLGCFVRDNATGNEMMLSNFHVMCVDDGWHAGDTMAQPSLVDGGACPADVVGALQRASLGGQVDCAVASHTARGYQCSIVDIGNVAGTAAAAVGMAVRKRGRTTGLTYGTVDTVDLTVSIDYCDGLGTVTLTHQIGINVDPAHSAKFGDHGDSGSVVVDGAANVVGLYFASGDSGAYGVANPIQAVLNALNVSMCVPKLPEIKKHEPDIKKSEIDIKKHEPDIKKSETDIKKHEPDVKKHEPDIKKSEVDIKKHEAEPIGKGLVEPIKGGMEPITPERPPIGDPREERLNRIESALAQLMQLKAAGMEQITPEQTLGVDPFEERLSRIEAALAQLTHFITPESRPDLEQAPLQYETHGRRKPGQ